MKPNDTIVTLKARPVMMGWCISAECEGATYVIETGLTEPEHRLKYWLARMDTIKAALALATGREGQVNL